MSNEREPANSHADQATHWWVLLDADAVTPGERSGFSEWVSRSPERVEAYLRMAGLMRALESRRIQWPETPTDELVREARAAPPDIADAARPMRVEPRGVRRAVFAGPIWPIAATVLIVLAAFGLFLSRPTQYATRVGEQRSVLLADGSLITLNTASKVEVNLDKRHRLIRLVRGEALFAVAHDAQRPFDVVAGAATVRAVGTQFNVDRRSQRTTVTVVEGRVAVDDPVASPNLTLGAGEQVTMTARTVTPAKRANIAAATAWTQRQLIFEDRPLGEVAEEFNRYNHGQIEIDGAELRQQHITGVFRANDPKSFIVFLSQIPQVQVRMAGNGRLIVSDVPVAQAR